MNCRDLVKQFDWYLGGWSLKMDSDPARRTLYGKAGACRFKDYGVEYRVLSNFWVTTRDRRQAIWNRMQQAIDTMRNDFLPERISAKSIAALISSINASEMDPRLGKEYYYPLHTLNMDHRR